MTTWRYKGDLVQREGVVATYAGSSRTTSWLQRSPASLGFISSISLPRLWSRMPRREGWFTISPVFVTTGWHRELLQERLEAFRDDPAAGRSWDEVRADLQRKYQPSRSR